MDKKTVILAVTAMLAGAGVGQVAPKVLNPYKVHAIDLRVYGDGSVHRSASGHRGPHDGVKSALCDDADPKVQARLKAEIVAAEAECAFESP